MISSDELYPAWVSKLETCQEGNGFDTEKPSVNVITWSIVMGLGSGKGGRLLTKEQVIRVGCVSPYTKYFY